MNTTTLTLTPARLDALGRAIGAAAGEARRWVNGSDQYAIEDAGEERAAVLDDLAAIVREAGLEALAGECAELADDIRLLAS
jgi:hypothetical protein